MSKLLQRCASLGKMLKVGVLSMLWSEFKESMQIRLRLRERASFGWMIYLLFTVLTVMLSATIFWNYDRPCL